MRKMSLSYVIISLILLVLSTTTTCHELPLDQDAMSQNDKMGQVPTRSHLSSGPLLYSTLLGGNGEDSIVDTFYGNNGLVYLVGSTDSSNLPVSSGAFLGGSIGYEDIFISAINLSTQTLEFSTYFGGSDGDSACGIEVDEDGNVYIAGSTSSVDLPVTANAFQATMERGRIGFISKFNPDLSELVFSTYIGSEDGDSINGMDIDQNGSVYITGNAGSNDYPITENAFNKSYPGSPAIFISKLERNGSALNYSTYIGSGSAFDISIDDHGNAFITGKTFPSQFYRFPITPQAYDKTANGLQDAFLTKLNRNGSALVFSTFLGGSGHDIGWDLALCENGDAVILGETDLSYFPTPDQCFGLPYGDDLDLFVMKVNSTGSDLEFLKFIGGSSTDLAGDVLVGPEGYVYLTGTTTSSSDFPVTYGVYQSEIGGREDSYIIKIEPDGENLGYCSYFGHHNGDYGTSLCMDEDRNMILSGHTYSSGFPTMGNQITPYRGFSDTYTSILNLSTLPRKIVDVHVTSGDRFVNLSWFLPEGDLDQVSSFSIYRGTTSGELGLYKNNVKDHHYNDTDVINGVEYFYQISSVNIVGEGALSKEVSAIPMTYSDPPLRPQAVSGDRFVHLTWEAPLRDGGAAITSFSVYRRDCDIGADYFEVYDGPWAFFNDTRIVNGQCYSYYITAHNSVGESAPSAVLNATPMGRPSSPQNLTGRTGGSFVNLCWDPPAEDGGVDEIGYNVYRGPSWFIREKIGSISGTLFFNDTKVVLGEPYYYQVTSFNEKGESKLSAQLRMVPMDVPGPPLDLASTYEGGRVTLTWRAPISDGGSEITGYRIYMGQDPVSKEFLAGVGPAETRFEIQITDVSRDHYFHVTAVNERGESVPSESVKLERLEAPSEPLDLICKAGYGYVLLSWDAPVTNGGREILRFIVLRSEGSETETEIASVGEGVLTFNDTDVQNGVVYIYRVTAENEVGLSPFSQPVTAVPGGVPSPPTEIFMTVYDSAVNIFWSPPSDNGGFGIIDYSVYRWKENGEPHPLATVDAGVLQYQDGGLKNGDEYFYIIRARNERGMSSPSDDIGIIPGAPPQSPQNLSAARKGDSIVLTWDEPIDNKGFEITHYRVYRMDEKGDRILLGEVSPVDLQFEDQNVDRGEKYSYIVTAVNEMGESDGSDEVEYSIKDAHRGYVWIVIISVAVAAIIASLLAFYLVRRSLVFREDPEKPDDNA